MAASLKAQRRQQVESRRSGAVGLAASLVKVSVRPRLCQNLKSARLIARTFHPKPLNRSESSSITPLIRSQTCGRTKTSHVVRSRRGFDTAWVASRRSQMVRRGAGKGGRLGPVRSSPLTWRLKAASGRAFMYAFALEKHDRQITQLCPSDLLQQAVREHA